MKQLLALALAITSLNSPLSSATALDELKIKSIRITPQDCRKQGRGAIGPSFVTGQSQLPPIERLSLDDISDALTQYNGGKCDMSSINQQLHEMYATSTNPIVKRKIESLFERQQKIESQLPTTPAKSDTATGLNEG